MAARTREFAVRGLVVFFSIVVCLLVLLELGGVSKREMQLLWIFMLISGEKESGRVEMCGKDFFIMSEVMGNKMKRSFI